MSVPGVWIALAVVAASSCMDARSAASEAPAMKPAAEIVFSGSGRIGAAPTTFRASAARFEPQAPERALLHVEGVDAGGGIALVRVFVGLATADVRTPTSDPHFIGVISRLGAGGAAPQRPEAFALPVPAALISEARTSGELSVTLVPIDQDGKQPTVFALAHGSITLR
jgi:hypothetical protein